MGIILTGSCSRAGCCQQQTPAFAKGVSEAVGKIQSVPRHQGLAFVSTSAGVEERHPSTPAVHASGHIHAPPARLVAGAVTSPHATELVVMVLHPLVWSSTSINQCLLDLQVQFLMPTPLHIYAMGCNYDLKTLFTRAQSKTPLVLPCDVSVPDDVNITFLNRYFPVEMFPGTSCSLIYSCTCVFSTSAYKPGPEL